MTIEIRELLIKAEIEEVPCHSNLRFPKNIEKMKDDEMRLIESISKQVLEILREERGGGI